MSARDALSRRGFVGGVAATVRYLTLKPGEELWAGATTRRERLGLYGLAGPDEDYDGYAKLAANENPFGPPDSVLKAMMNAVKYANRYGYPDHGIVNAIAAHHG